MKRLKVFLVAAMFFAVITMDSGCSQQRKSAANEISGKVTYKGAPVTGGTLSLYSKDNIKLDVPIQSDGTFRRSDPPLGEMIVTIETESVKAKTTSMTDPSGKMKMIAPKDVTMPVAQFKYVKIPDKYTDRKTTPLKWTVGADSLQKDFDLTD